MTELPPGFIREERVQSPWAKSYGHRFDRPAKALSGVLCFYAGCAILVSGCYAVRTLWRLFTR